MPNLVPTIKCQGQKHFCRHLLCISLGNSLTDLKISFRRKQPINTFLSSSLEFLVKPFLVENKSNKYKALWLQLPFKEYGRMDMSKLKNQQDNSIEQMLIYMKYSNLFFNYISNSRFI